jgi:hypothetical protein
MIISTITDSQVVDPRIPRSPKVTDDPLRSKARAEPRINSDPSIVSSFVDGKYHNPPGKLKTQLPRETKDLSFRRRLLIESETGFRHQQGERELRRMLPSKCHVQDIRGRILDASLGAGAVSSCRRQVGCFVQRCLILSDLASLYRDRYVDTDTSGERVERHPTPVDLVGLQTLK